MIYNQDMKIGYINTIKNDSKEKNQKEILSKYGIEKWFVENLTSLFDSQNTEFKKLLDFAREGDTIYILDFNRIANSSNELSLIVDELTNRKIALISIKENIDSSTAIGVEKLKMIKELIDFEKENFKSKQDSDIDIKKNGRLIGRQPIKIDKKLFEKTYSDYMNRKLTKIQFAELVQVTRPTLDKFIRAYETKTISEENNKYYVDLNKK